MLMTVLLVYNNFSVLENGICFWVTNLPMALL